MTRHAGGGNSAPNRPGPDQIVEDLLARWPETVPVFLRLKMACVGCDLAGFETVAEAAQAYGIAVERLLADLTAAIQGRQQAKEPG